MGLSRKVSEINGDFSRKLQNFPTMYFAPPLAGFLWNWVPAQVSENRNDGDTKWFKKF